MLMPAPAGSGYLMRVCDISRNAAVVTTRDPGCCTNMRAAC